MVASSQENFIRWNLNQRLQWDDFSGKVCDTSKFDAETFAEICYRYTSDNLKDFKFEVYANFNKNISWRRKNMQCDALLKHEQLHFNIAALFAIKLNREFENYHYTSNYNEEILEIFNKNKFAYQAMQLQYDLETNHSLNRQKQQEWENNLDRELEKTIMPYQLTASID